MECKTKLKRDLIKQKTVVNFCLLLLKNYTIYFKPASDFQDKLLRITSKNLQLFPKLPGFLPLFYLLRLQKTVDLLLRLG